MNLATYTRRAQTAVVMQQAAFDDDRLNPDRDLSEISSLSDRFLRAHSRLNEIELALHEQIQSGDRLELLRTLEVARMEYSDARFALSTRDAITSRR